MGPTAEHPIFLDKREVEYINRHINDQGFIVMPEKDSFDPTCKTSNRGTAIKSVERACRREPRKRRL